MDFLLSYGRSEPLKRSKAIEHDVSDLMPTAWERFLLLTRSIFWMYVILYSVVGRFIYATYILFFDKNASNWVAVLVLELLYAVDFFSAFMFRIKCPKRKTAPENLSSNFARQVWRNNFYSPRHIWMLVVDFISLIPIAPIGHFVHYNTPTFIVANVLPCLRIYRLFTFYVENMKNILRATALTALILNFTILWLFFTHTFVCVNYWVKNKPSKQYSEHSNSKFEESAKKVISFDYSSKFDWYLIQAYLNEFAMGNIGFGDIAASNDGERFIVIVIMIFGFLLLNGYFISALSSALAEKIRGTATLRYRISLMKSELKSRRVPEDLIRKLEKFYHSLWTSRQGVGSVLLSSVCLPDSLRSRINTDIFMPALNASVLFRSCDEFSKRAIAQVMEINLFMAGDVILKRSELNSDLLYVRKGTVEILSYQDDETRIMTFGAGSVFGQLALLLSTPARSEIHAATFCEILKISRKSLFSMISDYPKVKEIIFDVHRNLLLNAMADKFKPQSMKETPPGDAPGNVLSTKMFYKVPLEASKIARNDICVVNVCPFVFEPETIFLKLWNTLVTVIIVIILVYYPYCAVYSRKYPKEQEGFILFVDLILITNIYLSFSTAFYQENVLFSNLHDIVSSKFRLVTPYIDIIAVLPVHYFIHDDSREKPFLLCLRCLVMYKIQVFFIHWEYSVATRMVGLLRLIKYILYFFLFVYMLGFTFYLEACYNDPCIHDSWYVVRPQAANSQSPVWASIYVSILMVSGTGYGDITPGNMRDVTFVILACVIGSFFFIYLISEYSANLSLTKKPKQNFKELVYTINLFLMKNKMLPSVRLRVRQSLNLQWEKNQGYEFTNSRYLFYDTPVHLMDDINQFTKSMGLQKMKLFQSVSRDIIHTILARSHRILFPPHEVVIYAGEVCLNLLVIEEGYCEIIYGRNSSLKKIIGPGTDICTVELMLGITSLCNVRTLTHCSILRISLHHLLGCFKANPFVFDELEDCIAEIKNSEIVKVIQSTRVLRLHLLVRPSLRKSLFRFRFSRAVGGRWEFKKPFLRLGLCQWIRFFLGRATILPYGKFLKIWELSRCVFAFFSALLFPLLPFFELQVPALYYIGFILDATAWIDIYFRCHVGYYNTLNLLVTHPMYTSSHYVKGSFVLDFIFCFPFDRIMFGSVYDPSGYKPVTNGPINCIRMLRIFQTYRIPSTINNLGVDALSPPSQYLIFIMMLLFSILFLSTLTSILMLHCINYEVNREKKYKIVISKGYGKHFRDLQIGYGLTTKPFDIYFVNFYWITETALFVGYGDITAGDNKNLMIFVILVIMLSYLIFSYITLVISSYLSSVDLNLTTYQNRMSSLIAYLKLENVEPLLRDHIINYFEFVWEKQKGIKIRSVTDNFNAALKQDISLYFYEDTIKKVGAFRHWDETVFRVLSSEVDEINFMSGAAIYKAGDIISELYIVHSGEVTLVGKNENETITLGPSTVFGHVENDPRGQVNLSAVATKNAVVLYIKTTALYSLVGKIHGWTDRVQAQEQKKLREALNTTYELQSHQTKLVSTEYKYTIQYWLYRFSTYISVFYLCLSFLSINLVTYQFAFAPNSEKLAFSSIPIEILFFIKVFVIKFNTGYIDEVGDFVSDTRLIRRRYTKTVWFYLDLFTMIPFEVLVFAFKKEDRLYLLSMFRLTKLLRALEIQRFFNKKTDTLSVNMMMMQITMVLAWTCTLLHQCCCIWYAVSCPRAKCPNSRTWKKIMDGDFHNVYLSSMYFVVVVLTTTGFGDVVPLTLQEFFCVDFLCFVGFFYTAVFIGELISTVQKHLLAKTNYEFEVTALKTYLYVNDVPAETQDCVFRYVQNIWRNQNGHEMPELLDDAPQYLINEIKQSTYGHHINNNPVFGPCNPFFRKILINNLKRKVFFFADVIVNEGEVNRTVYFVHSGLVENADMGEKHPVRQYVKNTFFGLRQGVMPREPHTRTFIAKTTSIILTLDLADWKFLSEFYPKDIENIREATNSCKWN